MAGEPAVQNISKVSGGTPKERSLTGNFKCFHCENAFYLKSEVENQQEKFEVENQICQSGKLKSKVKNNGRVEKQYKNGKATLKWKSKMEKQPSESKM